MTTQASDYSVCDDVAQCFRGHSTDVRKAEKERASLIEEEIEVSTESVWASADTVGPI